MSASPFLPRLSIRQMLKLVAFGAIASACIAPAVRLSDLGVGRWQGLVMMEAVAVPLVLAVAAFPLVRRGPLKDWLIHALLATSTGVAFGLAIYFLGFLAGAVRMQLRWGTRPDWGPLAIDILVIPVLGLFLAFLAGRLVPGRCPRCRRWLLLRDMRLGALPGVPMVGRCLACGDRFRKVLGAWEPLAPAGDPAARSSPAA